MERPHRLARRGKKKRPFEGSKKKAKKSLSQARGRVTKKLQGKTLALPPQKKSGGEKRTRGGIISEKIGNGHHPYRKMFTTRLE